MTDKPRESLNLVERMAKRLAAEAAQGTTAQPGAPSFAERVAQKIVPNSPATAPVGQPPTIKSGQGLPQQEPANIASSVASRAARQATDVVDDSALTLKQIRLDFRVLRQNGMIT